MKQDYPAMSVEVLCRLFGKTRHAYYDHQWRFQGDSLKDEIILQLVHRIRETLPRLGTRKLQHLLKPQLLSHGIEVGRDAYVRAMATVAARTKPPFLPLGLSQKWYVRPDGASFSKIVKNSELYLISSRSQFNQII